MRNTNERVIEEKQHKEKKNNQFQPIHFFIQEIDHSVQHESSHCCIHES